MAQSFYLDSDLTGSSDASDSAVSLGFSFITSVPGTVTHIRFRANSSNVSGTYTGALYEITDDDPPAGSGGGTLMESATFGALAMGAWNVVALGAGVAIEADKPYRARVFTSAARYVAKANVFAAGNITRGSIIGLQDGAAPTGFTSLRNGTFFYDALASYPQDAFNAAAYFVDIVFEPDGGTSEVTSDLDVRWRVASLVSSDADIRWRVANLVSSDLDTRWRVFTVVTSDLDVRWSVAGIVSSDLQALWRVASLVSSDLDVRWLVSGLVASDLSVSWVVLGRVTSDLRVLFIVVSDNVPESDVVADFSPALLSADFAPVTVIAAF
jgi:hypothetical protein